MPCQPRASARERDVPTGCRDLLAHARAAKGFMPEDEGAFLHATALAHLGDGPALEIGTLLRQVGDLARRRRPRRRGSTVFTLDHHRGSEENQAGWEHHDASLVDDESGLMDTLPVFRRTIARAGLEDEVVAVVGPVHHGRRPLAYAARAAVHRRRARRGARTERLHRVRPVGAARRRAGHPRRLRAPRGRRPGAVPRLAAGRRRRRVHARTETVGSMRVLTRTSGLAGEDVG